METMQRFAVPCELHADQDGPGTFVGVGALFDTRVEDLFNTVLRPGSFAQSLRERPSVPVLWSHDPAQPIGKTTLLRESDRELVVHGRLVTTTGKGADTYALLKAGVVTGMSIGFTVREWVHVAAADGTRERHVSALDLFEISLVAFPASDRARVSSVHRRGAVDVDAALEQLEDQAHQAGLELSPAAPGDDADTTTRAIVRDLETARTLPDQIRALELAQLSIDLSMALFGSRHRR